MFIFFLLAILPTIIHKFYIVIIIKKWVCIHYFELKRQVNTSQHNRNGGCV